MLAGEQSSRAAYLKSLDKEVDSPSHFEKEDQIERVESPSRSRSSSPSKSGSRSSGESDSPPRRRLVRFEDGDPENPNNCEFEVCF